MKKKVNKGKVRKSRKEAHKRKSIRKNIKFKMFLFLKYIMRKIHLQFSFHFLEMLIGKASTSIFLFFGSKILRC